MDKEAKQVSSQLHDMMAKAMNAFDITLEIKGEYGILASHFHMKADFKFGEHTWLKEADVRFVVVVFGFRCSTPRQS